jgi:hypothetical protein
MKNAAEMIEYYKRVVPLYRHNRQVMWQYVDMARGGTGGKLYGIEGEPSCREFNYPDEPDTYFQEVCEGMGWSYLADENESQ